jgi:hypothetical protein
VDICSRVGKECLLAHVLPGPILNDDRRRIDRVDQVNSEGSSHDRRSELGEDRKTETEGADALSMQKVLGDAGSL